MVSGPQLGLVVSYAYLWHREHRAGRDEGVKDRPCVIVLAMQGEVGGEMTVRVVTVTHSAPDRPICAVELPSAVKRHLGLDAARSWVMVDEVNEFSWPGFDLRPIAGSRDTYIYGLLPPRLFDALLAGLAEVWANGQGRTTPRD